MTRTFAASILTALLCIHCGSSTSNSGTGGAGLKGVEGAHGSCASSGDCAASEICLSAAAGGGACVPTCSASGSACSGTASCGQVGAVSVNVCQQQSSSSQSGTAGAASADTDSQNNYIPCKSDADCQKLDSTSICAEDSHSDKQCTIPCTADSDCSVPGLAGFSVDFLSCQTDQSNTSRQACLLNPKCESNPLSCTTGFTNPNGGGGASGVGGSGAGLAPGIGGDDGLPDLGGSP